ncbi:MAG TPA: lipoprotein-releasing ABC transporter permease subunit [Burkholderiaceae bacterium]
MNIFNKQPFEWLVGLRYTRGGKRSGRNSFISIISIISMGGIALGVWALIVVPSVMNGFQKEVLDKMVSVLSHIEVIDASGAMSDWHAVAQEVFKNKEVRGAAPYTASPALLLNDGTMRPALVRGVLPEEEPKVSEIGAQIFRGKFDDLRPGEFNIVLGSELARALHVDVGQKVTLGTNQGQVTLTGVMPRLKAFRVVGIFDSGEYEYNSTLAVVHMDDALKMFQLDGPTGVRLKLDDMHAAPYVARELSEANPGTLEFRDWSKQNPTWFAAVRTEKRMMSIILTLIVVVSAFNLITTLVMTVSDKQADIAILRTLGASPASIMKIFMIQGGVIGLMGTGLGVVFGVVTALKIDVIVPFIERLLGVKFLSADVYLISEMPSDLQWPDVWVVAAVAIALSFAATIYPSWAAARVKPAEALRYE